MGGNVPFYQLGLGSIYHKAKAMKPTKWHAINYILGSLNSGEARLVQEMSNLQQREEFHKSQDLS